MSNVIPVTPPVTYVYATMTITNVRYNITDFVLFQSITVMVQLLDQNNILVDNKILKLTGGDYANWVKDHTYLVTYINEMLGIDLDVRNFYPIDYNSYAIRSRDLITGNPNKYAYLIVDNSSNMNIVLPQGYSRDITNTIIDVSGVSVHYGLLGYDYDGKSYTFGSFSVDVSNNPILPSGHIVEVSGIIKDASGEHIIMITP